MTDAASVAAELRRLLPHAHAPYSRVHVAAAVEDAEGRLHYGVNVENAAYPQGACAEVGAISAAVTQGSKGLVRVYVASSLPEAIWPCGGCRQRIFELAQPGCEVISFAPEGTAEHQTIEALLPLGFRLDVS